MKKTFPLFILTLVAGCTQLSQPSSQHFTHLDANGAIHWSDGNSDEMIISPSGSTLTFPAARASVLSPSGVTIYTRIDSARNGECEHYYTEGELRRRLTICANTEVTMMNEGKVERVGRLRLH
ncbi:hypothetical protein [Thaumasiovibrio sp. DFM-14]|uniref:hypothetical protein n=1 Tax=Thaumasiovibrio sp. DFM-14 TaxID=3384792 RepID=UPI00399F3869